MKKKPSAPEKQRIIIYLIGWIIELIVDAVRKNRETKNR